MNSDFSEFRFTPSMLAGSRPLGISAYMRIKNGAEFLRLSIESHLPFYDEIVAVYNDCTDDTEEILLQLQAQHPDKIRVFHYLPKVAKMCSDEHRQTPTDSVHSLANYYNYALAKTRYSVAAKLDDDHLAISCNLAPLVERIRTDIAAGKRRTYTFSGPNVKKQNGVYLVGGGGPHPFCGNNDHQYHPVSPEYRYVQGHDAEIFRQPSQWQVTREYAGIMFFHLKPLKKHGGYAYLDEPLRSLGIERLINQGLWLPWDEFCSPATRKKLIAARPLADRIQIALYSVPAILNLRLKWIKKHPSLRKVRLARLQQDLAGIDFKRDLLDALER